MIERRLRLSTRSSTPTWSTAVCRPSTLPSGPGRPPAHAGRARWRARGRSCRAAGRPWDGEDTPASTAVREIRRRTIAAHDRPAHDAAGAAAAEAAGGPAADARPSPAGAVRLRRAPVRADVGRRAGARAHRAGGGRRAPATWCWSPRTARPGPAPVELAGLGGAGAGALGGPRRRDRRRRRGGPARSRRAGAAASRASRAGRCPTSRSTCSTSTAGRS